MNLPYAVIERAKKYRAQANDSGWPSWCDGDKINEGHFQGIDVQSILANDVEVKLCKDCRQSICKDENPTKTFTVTFPDKSEKYIKNVYSYRVDTESGILYLKDGNGEIIAAFNEWWSFTIKEEG